ncbi:EcsC family protein [Roseofilum casamattae]|uniref:EcsC family protein n=1 Tax=Roseofilum casamattae BLCC-M143 TaxID=3022442 RepID=A0ABT7BTC2_9CYAN|nr:EcsC family protein [Roseofilum casamattae]MDJ1182433.1 hypothetical protein [Roseofilum casamattae BLCC-M143]
MTSQPNPETELIPVSQPEEAIVTAGDSPKKPRWGGLFGKVADAAAGTTGAMQKATEVVGNVAGSAGSAIAQKAEAATSAVTNTQSLVTGAMQKATGVAENVADNAGSIVVKQTETAGQIAINTQSAVTGAVGKATGMVGNAAGNASSAIVQQTGAMTNATLQTGGAIAKTSLDIAENIGKTVMQTPAQIAGVLKLVSENPWMESALQTLPTDWMLNIIEQVDVTKAKESIVTLQEKFPEESASSISHRVMRQKALLVGATHVATGLSGASLLLIGVDLAATTALQAELVYQIAYAYGFDLEETERKAEVLTIFGLAFGSSKALEAGLGLLKTVPLAGAAISGSANAALIYGLGYAACRFYEAKLSPVVMTAALESMQEENEHYLEAAITQETLMDRVLVHMILAGNPDKTWEEIVPELEPMNLSPASLDAIATALENPPSLEELLAQLDPDFVPSLLWQCQKMAELDEIVTPEELRVLKAIRQYLPDETAIAQSSVAS